MFCILNELKYIAILRTQKAENLSLQWYAFIYTHAYKYIDIHIYTQNCSLQD